ncbi:DUF397 domain-containing protein [Streptomyces chitinivorans]|uniref:DUF397 domain-containing protein n=1 Tax=Streptomyces chitinivorans TaxID=1257027 RepID=A0ABW7HV47_9ACTN|nr:DUF397 domain-containing protein [Streptomyces chitinivorans]MDH2408959.1 DUF397 domain-containing protein [Streptomyces chitinivorans]
MSMRVTDSSALGVIWTASSYSGNTNCVETAALPGGRTAVRDSKDPAGPALAFGAAPWAAFLERVRAGN